MDENQKLTLIAMADHLQHNVTDDQFDMELWRVHRSCGTVGCAIGHTVHLIHGLDLVCVYNNVLVSNNVLEPHFSGEHEGKAKYGFQAVEAALGLTEQEASWLFGTVRYVYNHTRKTVYTRIRSFAKGELECPL